MMACGWLYGMVLMPMGAVIVADYWFLPKMGLRKEDASHRGLGLSWPALVAWLGALAVAFALPYEIFFIALPGWFIAVLLFVVCSFIQQKYLAGAGERRPQ